jgi:hypothetical protein
MVRSVAGLDSNQKGTKMENKSTSKARIIKKQYTRAEVLESLVYELKPFVILAAGFVCAVYFTQESNQLAKYCSLAIIGSGVSILYWRAKDRGVIQ